MPQAFLNCIARGGKVITKKVNAQQYIKICYRGGKSYAGEVKTREGEKENEKVGK